MKNTVFYLASCSTCKKIIKSLPPSSELVYHDIRQEPLTEEIIKEMKDLAGSYEALFSKRAQLYKERDLKNKTLTEDDFKALLLDHYTFLSRPVFVIDNKIYIGNSQKVTNEVIEALS